MKCHYRNSRKTIKMNAEPIYRFYKRRFLIAVCLFDLVNDGTESVNVCSGGTKFQPRYIVTIWTESFIFSINDFLLTPQAIFLWLNKILPASLQSKLNSIFASPLSKTHYCKPQPAKMVFKSLLKLSIFEKTENNDTRQKTRLVWTHS